MSEETDKAIATARALIAAGKKAAAEGQAILAQSRTQSGRRARRVPALLPRFKSVSKPEPKPDPPDYVLTSADNANVKAVVTLMKIITIGKSAGLRAAAYRDIGPRLYELHQNRDNAEWGNILHRECGLAARRAYELMAIATDVKSLDQLSFEAYPAIKPHREKKAA
jgi:hypothetical protein